MTKHATKFLELWDIFLAMELIKREGRIEHASFKCRKASDKKQKHLGLAMDKGAPLTGRIPDFLQWKWDSVASVASMLLVSTRVYPNIRCPGIEWLMTIFPINLARN